MSISRFYTTEDIQEKVIIKGHDAYQLIHVLRCKKGDLFKLFNGSQKEWLFRVEDVKKDNLTALLIETSYPQTETLQDVILCQAIPKGQKMDLIVQKATELGVKEIYPLITDRSLTSINTGKYDRWIKIAEEAVEQSGRLKEVKIHKPLSFEKAVSILNSNDLAILFCPDKEAISLKELNTLDYSKVFVFIGPEGDFSEKEINMAKERGINIYSLGKRILRTETASITALSIILYKSGEI